MSKPESGLFKGTSGIDDLFKVTTHIVLLNTHIWQIIILLFIQQHIMNILKVGMVVTIRTVNLVNE